MSTRYSVYYEADGDGVHIYQELADPNHDGFYLEYGFGPFLVNIPLSRELSDIILRGLPKETRPNPAAQAETGCL